MMGNKPAIYCEQYRGKVRPWVALIREIEVAKGGTGDD
jgi:hypothetical protein